MISKILIANRGEIAVRIVRACKEMGITSVAVFSDVDKDALHVSLADESYCIGPYKAKDSYLNMGAILSIATACGAEAIHPGYGLLSENAEFARLCRECNIIFIGPPPEVIEKMGKKDEALRTMQKAGVNTVPGSAQAVTDINQAISFAEEIGYPVLLKARSGGGGKGIRKVDNSEQLERLFLSASAEAANSFNDGALYVEKYLFPVKHVEVQILCDNDNNIAILGERDCSVQRKNQKMLEESPCIALNNKTRAKLFEMAKSAAKAINYTGAGTLEFLLDGQGKLYFMEMNTRLQVEHTVSEMVTGLDLVKWQIRIADGMNMDFLKEGVSLNGHAIECRINAEKSDNGMPSCGKISLLHIPGGPNVRFDTALYQDYNVLPFYDSMIGKLIVYAKTREEAIRKMKAALCELVIEGIHCNREALIEIIEDEEFESGRYTTDFLTKKFKDKVSG